MQGILIQNGLSMTSKLLKTAFDLTNQALSATFNDLIKTFGVVLQRQSDGTFSTEGSASAVGTTVTVKAFSAILKDSDGIIKVIDIASDQTIDMSALSDATYKLAFSINKINTEVGTITLANGSANVVGVGTTFTKRLGSNLALVIQGSGSGNNGVYQIQSVTDDTHLVLSKIFTGTTEATLAFSCGGYFPDADFTPGTTAGYVVYEINDWQYVLTTSALSSNQIYLAQIVKSGSTLTITDERTPFQFAPHTHLAQDISGGTWLAGQTFFPTVTINGFKTTDEAPGQISRSLVLSGDVILPYLAIAVTGNSDEWRLGYNSAQSIYLNYEGGSELASTEWFNGGKVQFYYTIAVGTPNAIAGTIAIYNASNNYYAIIDAPITTSNKTLHIPNVNGTFGMVDGGQDFTSIGTITPSATDTKDIGTSTKGFRDEYLARKLYLGSTGTELEIGMYIKESYGDSFSPVTQTAILYSVDNGSGKCVLKVLFPSGPPQQISIEP